jgi:erythronate-4-phosphate dehydrogenase
MTPMRILADQNIPYALEIFSQFGEVALAPGRSIVPELVQDVDILIVRSVTRVDQALLVNSAIRFVGTATIGTDHIDTAYLKEAGITFADAAGSNATSVAEYVMAALMHLDAKDLTLKAPLPIAHACAIQEGEGVGGMRSDLTIGIVGVGNVGSRVQARASILGLKVLLNDPPREQREGAGSFVPLQELLSASDIVTFHTPLTRKGDFPTYHLAGEKELNWLREGAILINTSRGAVVDNVALLGQVQKGRLGAVILDVWENEPNPNPDLLARVTLGTPHIAGYSYDGKIAGTRMMAEAVARHLEVPLKWNESLGSEYPAPPITVTGSGSATVRDTILSAYPIEEDHVRMRAILDLLEAERGPAFDRLRKEYPIRREFRNFTVSGRDFSGQEREILCGLGFQIH